MAIKIVHISDIHFGKDINLSLWDALKKLIARIQPNLLFVTGDLVHHPIEADLQHAKTELEKLANEAKAKLLVVPGNHDLFYYGNDIRLGRVGIFY